MKTAKNILPQVFTTITPPQYTMLKVKVCPKAPRTNSLTLYPKQQPQTAGHSHTIYSKEHHPVQTPQMQHMQTANS